MDDLCVRHLGLRPRQRPVGGVDRTPPQPPHPLDLRRDVADALPLLLPRDRGPRASTRAASAGADVAGRHHRRPGDRGDRGGDRRAAGAGDGLGGHRGSDHRDGLPALRPAARRAGGGGARTARLAPGPDVGDAGNRLHRAGHGGLHVRAAGCRGSLGAERPDEHDLRHRCHAARTRRVAAGGEDRDRHRPERCGARDPRRVHGERARPADLRPLQPPGPDRAGTHDGDDVLRLRPHRAHLPRRARACRNAPAGTHRRPHLDAQPPPLPALRARRDHRQQGDRRERGAAARGPRPLQGAQRHTRPRRRGPAPAARWANGCARCCAATTPPPA